MIVGGFSEEEQQDRAKQAWIYCRWKKNSTKAMNNAPTPLFSIRINNKAAVVDEEEPLSSVTSASGTLSDGDKAKRVQMTRSAAQSIRMARQQEKKKYNHAFKQATIVFAREQQKKGGLLARGVTKLVKNEYNVDVCPRTVQIYVKKSNIGVLPQRRGPKGKINDHHYKNLCLAFESFVMIHQINGNVRKQTYKTLAALLQEVVYGDGATAGSQQAHHLLQQVLKDTAINLNAGKTKNVEDRRVHWTNHKNISMWFDNWEHNLVALGTAHVDPITNEVCIPEEQLRNIANLDETNILLDSSTTNCGG
jgi:hypothetical protein